MKNFLNKNLGITLIALIITIIILIILVGVTISTLVNNGIIDKAKTATQEYKNAQDYEETQIAKYTNDIDSYVSGNRDFTPISYSTEEQDTGLKWIGGKTIYQKTVVANLNNNSDYSINHNISNIDDVLNYSAIIVRSDVPTYSFKLPYIHSTESASVRYVDSSKCQISINGRFGTGSIYITIQYTKTQTTE